MIYYKVAVTSYDFDVKLQSSGPLQIITKADFPPIPWSDGVNAAFDYYMPMSVADGRGDYSASFM